MSSVVDDLAGDSRELDQSYVRRRIEDWRQRIINLYDDTSAWLGPNFSTSTSHTVLMNEELMKHHDVTAINLPLLEIFYRQNIVARLVPRALWIIGVNGRIDFFKGEKQFIIVDRSNEIGFVDWQIASAEHRRELRAFDGNALREIMSA